MERDWQEFFRPEDFEAPDWKGTNASSLSWIMRDRANTILREELKKVKRVYWNEKTTGPNEIFTSTGKRDSDTHTALLIDEKEINAK